MSGFGYRNLGFGGGKFVAPDTTFDIPNSLRLDGTSAYLTRTPAGAGSLRKWTFSCWLKRSTEDSNNQSLFNGGTDVSSPTDSYFGFNSSQKFYHLELEHLNYKHLMVLLKKLSLLDLFFVILQN